MGLCKQILVHCPVLPLSLQQTYIFKLHKSVISKISASPAPLQLSIREYFAHESSSCEKRLGNREKHAQFSALLLLAGWQYTWLVCVKRVARIKCHNSNASALTATRGPDDGQNNFGDAIPDHSSATELARCSLAGLGMDFCSLKPVYKACLKQCGGAQVVVLSTPLH